MSNNGYASRDDFWKFHGREYRSCDFPGVGRLMIQSLSDGEQRELAARTRDEFGRLKDPEFSFAYRAIAQIVDPETKEPLFGDIDLEKLAGMRSNVTYPIYDAMIEFATGTATIMEDDENAEEAEKKS